MLRANLLAFFASVLCSLVLTRFVRNFAISRGWTHTPSSDRHFHRQPVPRLGGIAVSLTFTIVVCVAASAAKLLGLPVPARATTALGLAGPTLIVVLTGLYDDLRGLGPYSKFGIQSFAALLLYLGGFGIQRLDLFSSAKTLQTVVGLSLTILWVVLITNAFNLIDGLDGLAAGSASFSTLVLFVTSLREGNNLVSFLAIVLAGAILGFLRFNLNPATIFLGDCGSLFIGFMLSALALAGSQKAPTMVAVAIPVVSFGLPIMDVAIAVARRFLSGRPLFGADNEHIHHKLLKLGFSPRQVVLILYGISALLALLSLAMLHGAGSVALVLVVLGAGMFVGVQQLRYHEFFEVERVLERTINQKRIIENNLSIRRAAESLSACSDIFALCGILTETLRPLGFDGFVFQFPAAVWLPESLRGSLSKETKGAIHCCWAADGLPRPKWELSLELTSSSGRNHGSFAIYRQVTNKPFLMDLNLLSDRFYIALSGAVDRAVIQKYDVSKPRQRHQDADEAASAPAARTVGAS